MAEPIRAIGRPRRYQKGERVTTAIRIPKAIHDRLVAECERRDIGVNAAVVRGAELWLDAREGKEL